MKFIDFHCDTLMYAVYDDPPVNLRQDARRSVDFQRLKEGGVTAQFFSIFLPTLEELRRHMPDLSPDTEPQKLDQIYSSRLFSHFHKALAENQDLVAFAGNAEDVRKNEKAGKLSCLLTFEDGRALAYNLDNIKKYYDLGIRLITLTWNSANCLGFPHSRNPRNMKKGLTGFGLEALEVMNDLGIIIDVSHLSDGGFYDVAKHSKKPFVASHSNCRAVARHQRNLSDDMLRTLAEKGGVAGLNFSPYFLKNQAGLPPRESHSRIEDMVLQLNHMKKVGGEDLPALGSDFDGISPYNLEIADPTDLTKLVDALEKEGWTGDQIDKVCWKNALRLMEDVL